VGLLALVILIIWPRINRRIPGPLIAIIVATAVVQLFDLPVDTIGTRFGVLEASLPRPTVPDLSFSEAMRLVSPAFAIALLGAIESLLSAVVADGMIGGHHRSNMELVAQGIANVASPMFGGIPATGAIARTATNVKNGGRTPVAGMVHALVLLLVTLLFGKWAQLIPMAALAAVLLMVAYHMSEWRTFIDELRAPRADVAVLLLTFALTVVVDLTVAIEVGMVLSAFLFMQRMAEVTNVSAFKRELKPEIRDDLPSLEIPEGVQIFEISGAFFFGAVETFKDTLRQVNKRPKVLIIWMRDVTFLDGTGLRALRDVVRRSKQERTLVLIAEIHAQPLAALERSPLGEELAGDVYHALEDAVDRARTHLADRIPTPLETPIAGPSR
jgi:SulP family sulfate permease